MSAHKVYTTPLSHIINSPSPVKSMVEIDHVIDTAGTLSRLKYAVKMTMLGKHLVITCAALLGSTKNVLSLAPVTRN